VVGRWNGDQVGQATAVASARGPEPEGAAGWRSKGAAASEAATAADGALAAGELKRHDDPLSDLSLGHGAADLDHFGDHLVPNGERSREDPFYSDPCVQIPPCDRQRTKHRSSGLWRRVGSRLPDHLTGCGEDELAHLFSFSKVP
jgi:hypothetical protein